MSATLRFVVDTDPVLLEAIDGSNNKLEAFRSEVFMAFQDLMNAVAETAATLQKIDGDVTRLNTAVGALEAQVAALAGSLTPEQQAALEAAVANVKAQAKAIDDRTPEPAEPPPPAPPVNPEPPVV